MKITPCVLEINKKKGCDVSFSRWIGKTKLRVAFSETAKHNKKEAELLEFDFF